MINKLLILYQASCIGTLHKARSVATSLTWNNKLHAVRYRLYACVCICACICIYTYICVHMDILLIFDMLFNFIHFYISLYMYIHIIYTHDSQFFVILSELNINANIFLVIMHKNIFYNLYIKLSVGFRYRIYLNLIITSIIWYYIPIPYIIITIRHYQ